MLRATFESTRKSVRELVGRKMDRLAHEFHDTHNMKVREEIEQLAGLYGELKKSGSKSILA